MLQTKVRQLEDESTVHYAVGTLQISMGTDFTVVYVGHALSKKLLVTLLGVTDRRQESRATGAET